MARPLTLLRIPEADPGQRRLLGGLLGRADFSVAPCQQCTSHCCKLRVLLSIPEALRIGFTLGMPLDFFLDVVVQADPAIDLDERWAHPLMVEGGRAQLGLKRGEHHHCVHVVRPGKSTSHCGIYGLRPAVCKLYPYSFEDPDGNEDSVGNQSQCPVFWLATEPARAAVEEAWYAWRSDMELDVRMAGMWNEQDREDRTEEGLMAWLADEAARHLGHHPEDLVPIPRRSFGFIRKLSEAHQQKSAEADKGMADDDDETVDGGA